jgi:HisJ family histidinol phosphate phosphatase
MKDPRIAAIPDTHGHAKGEHKLYAEERPIPYSARMLFLWFYHAALRGQPRFLMVADHINYLTFEDPAAVNLVRRALKLAEAGDLYGAAETAGVDLAHAAVVSEGLRRGMRFIIGAEVDNDPRARPDAQNIVDAMRPDGLIRSIHFLSIEHPVHGPNWQWPFDNPEFASLYETVGVERVWELYMAAVLDAIEKLPAHIIGRFYAAAKFGHWPAASIVEGYEDRLIAACRDRNVAVGIDTRFLYRYFEDETDRDRYVAANLRLMRKAKEAGVGIAIGSDAHSPKDQGGGFDAVLTMLDEVGINELVFPIGGRFARVALRATKPPPEPRPEPVAAADEAAQADGAPARARPRRPSRAKPKPVEPAPKAARSSPTPARTAASAPKAAATPPPAKEASRPRAAVQPRAASSKAKPAPKPAPKPVPKPAPKPAPKLAPKPAQKPAPKPTPKHPKAVLQTRAKTAARPAATRAAAKSRPAGRTAKPAPKAAGARLQRTGAAKPKAKAKAKAPAKAPKPAPRKRAALKPVARKPVAKKPAVKRTSTKSRR